MSAVSDLTLSGTQFAGILMYLKTVDIISNQENTILMGASNKQYEGYSALANFYSSDYFFLIEFLQHIFDLNLKIMYYSP